ncbi:MAG: RagB/SusD family nutrient uptake outer membrane protein [Bacteroidales bacterium]|nr:RagB/SusD family nutrient uptake outer membrane protein [Bacteroidales bacterium]
MKKIIIIASALCALALSSCTLEEKSYTEMSRENYVKDASEAQTVLLGVYRNMSTEGLYSYHLSLLFTISSDIAQCEGSGNTAFRVIPTNSHTASTPEIATTWSSLYSAIYSANNFIETVQERMPSWTGTDAELGRIYIAEARTLRALFNFELVRWWGNVVLMKTTADSRKPASEYVQAKPEDVYAFIEEDLKAAIEDLPWAGDDAIRGDGSFRVSKGTALGLLTKVYCYWAGYPLKDESKWALAANTGRLLAESGKHYLNPSYEKVWYNTCNGIWDPHESLLEVSFYSPTGLNGDDCVGRIGKWNGVSALAVDGVRGRNAANWKVVYPFTQKWSELGDPRFALSIADYKYGNSSSSLTTTEKVNYLDLVSATASEDQKNKQRQLFTPGKWDTEKYVQSGNYLINNDKSNVNWYVMRYSDALLLFAEAENEANGPTAGALDAVNLVRRRAFGDTAHDVLSGVSQDELRQIIRDERAYELCFEGHRKQDLIRWGIYFKTIKQTAQDVVDWFSNGNYSVANYTIEGRHELLPIPQRDLDLMISCTQNPGWGK